MFKPQHRMITQSAFLLAITLLFCWNSASYAQAPAATAPPEAAAAGGPEGATPAADVFVLRTYDVGDLVITIRDYPYPVSLQDGSDARASGRFNGGGGGFGGGGGGGLTGGGGGGGGYFSVPDEQQSSQTQSHTKAITSSAPRTLLCQFGGGDSKSDKDGKSSKESAPSGGGGGGGRGGPARPLANDTAVTMDDLVDVLTNTVAPITWETNGGEGKVEPLGNTLIVWQTARGQQMVELFLKQIREASGHRHTLTVDARWLLLTSDELDTLSAQPPDVDRKALATFTRRPGTIRGITNCFSGQLVYLVSGTKRSVVSGYIPVVGSTENPDRAGTLVSSNSPSPFRLVQTRSQRSVGYQPIVETPNFGALLEIRPTAMGPSDVIVDLKSTLTAPSDEVTEKSRGTVSPDELAPAVDRVAIETQELATTMRMPAGKPVLVGGMTYVPGSAKASDDTKSPEHRQLYLVLEIH